MSTMIASTTYYVVVHNGFTREWPSGIRRRTVIDESAGTTDEAWTANRKWEPSTFFTGPFFGDFSNEDIPRVEVNVEEADQVRGMLGIRPRGGPFTKAGQKWLQDHPEDPAAKYLGVPGPEYDALAD
jgi:hypothetical protein